MLKPGDSVRIGAEGPYDRKQGRWETQTSPAKQVRNGRLPQCRIVRISRNVASGEGDLEETVADFHHP